ncbi:MAG: family 43 glycosylhydrolase [Planctomycetota bacterium]|nr:family 43 glycosylhydrolase [Planctomycetota bacterium]
MRNAARNFAQNHRRFLITQSLLSGSNITSSTNAPSGSGRWLLGFFLCFGLHLAEQVPVLGDDLSKHAPTSFFFATRVDSKLISDWDAWGGKWQSKAGVLSVTDCHPAKALIKGVHRDDFEMTVQVRAEKNSQAGIIFRVSEPGFNIDQYNGYYIGIHAGHENVVWGASDGNWHAIANRPTAVPHDQWISLRLLVRGNQIQAWLNQLPIAVQSKRFPKFDGIDTRFPSGRIGLRALGTGAEFRNVKIRDIPLRSSHASFTNPVQMACADPGVLLFEGTYYAFCTYSSDHPNMPRGIRLYTSKNLSIWKDQGFAITQRKSWGQSRFWAPDIIQRGDNFYLYYAVDERICVAKAPHPSGPFEQIGDLPIEPATIRIDAHVFRDDNAKFYFYYVHFNQGNEIWGGELNDDMVTVKPETLKRMIKPDQPWEQHRAQITEGPAMLKHGETYYLTYSGSHFESPQYAVGYATANHPLGPWKKHQYNPVMKSTAYAHGTAHHGFTTSPDQKELFIVYHRHFDLTQTEPRQMAIDRVQFVEQSNGPALLEIHGPTSSPQPLPSGAAIDFETGDSK